jgi:hypothetical protein
MEGFKSKKVNSSLFIDEYGRDEWISLELKYGVSLRFVVKVLADGIFSFSLKKCP